MSKHVYVMGSNSFSAAHFINHLLEQGFLVTGISRSQEYHPVFLPYPSKENTHPKNFSFLQADFNIDMKIIQSAIKKDKPAYMVNFAAQGMVAQSWQNPKQWLYTNSLAPVSLYEILRNQDNFEKFVQISTPEVYGSTGHLIKESLHYEPSTPYAVSKAAADMMLMAYYKAYSFPVVFTRAVNVYGPCQQLYRIIPKAILSFLLGQTLELHGGGHSLRSFIHIEDVAIATEQIMKRAHAPEIYHISPLQEGQISIQGLVCQIAKQMQIDPEKHIQIVEERLGKDASYSLDASKLHHNLQWQESINLEQGIEDVIAWIKKHLDILKRLPQEYIHKV